MTFESSGSDIETLTDPIADGPVLLGRGLVGWGLVGWGAAILAALFAALCCAIVLFGDGRDNRPHVRLEVGPFIHTNAEAAPWSEGIPALKPGRRQAQGADRAGAAAPPDVSAPDEKARQVMRPLYAGAALVADPTLVENTPQGPLPRISATGRTPLAAYAGRAAPPSGKPKIAIVMLGFGASADATTSALAALPPAVTVGFAPRSNDMQNLVNEARSRGHEVLLQLPMEPADYPDSDPGPHTLRAGQGASANLQHLAWALTRFTGYVGVANDSGARFLSNSEALEPVMTYLTRRGLMFYDGGSTPKSASPDLARQAGTAFARGSLAIDQVQDSAAIDRALSDLEAKARAQGSAAGTAFLYPVSVDRVVQWSRSLASRGFVLVPASAIVEPSK